MKPYHIILCSFAAADDERVSPPDSADPRHHSDAGSEEDEIQSNGRLLMAMMSQSSGSMFARYLDRLIVLFLDKEQHQVLSKF